MIISSIFLKLYLECYLKVVLKSQIKFMSLRSNNIIKNKAIIQIFNTNINYFKLNKISNPTSLLKSKKNQNQKN